MLILKIPGGLVQPGDLIHLEFFLHRQSGSGNINVAISGRNTATPGSIQEFVDMMGTNSNDPARVEVSIVVNGDTDFIGYMDHSNSGNTGLDRNASAASNVDFSLEWELSTHIKDKTMNSAVWTIDAFRLEICECALSNGITEVTDNP